MDGSTKMIAIHEQMNARDVCILLAERNHKPIGPNWTLVERLTDLHLGEPEFSPLSPPSLSVPSLSPFLED